MADFRIMTTHKTIYEVNLPHPTNTVELEKALAAARREWKAMYGGDDLHEDTFTVIVAGGRLRIQWFGPEATTEGII